MYILAFLLSILIGVIIGLDFNNFFGRRYLNPDFISMLISGISAFIMIYLMYAFNNSGLILYFIMACIIWLIMRALYKCKELEDIRNGKVR